MSTSVSLAELLERELAGVLALTRAQLEQLEAHYELLLRWNQKMNLTTVTKLPEAGLRHYAESLFLAARVESGSVVDIGSGPGFPGIPLAIARPECRVDLVESHQRKAVFLREAARHLPNVRVVAARAEAVRGPYDWLVSRAVDPRELVRLKLASRFAVLLGAEDAAVFSGATIVPLPWGERRILAVGNFSVS